MAGGDTGWVKTGCAIGFGFAGRNARLAVRFPKRSPKMRGSMLFAKGRAETVGMLTTYVMKTAKNPTSAP